MSRSAVLTAALIVLGAALIVCALTLKGQIDENRRLLAGHTVADAKGNLEAQKLCSDQAEKLYAEDGYKDHYVNPQHFSHYSAGLSKCFLSIKTLSQEGRFEQTASRLVDAFEGADYGYYLALREAGASTGKLVVCWVALPDRSRQNCHSEDDWRSLTAQYLK